MALSKASKLFLQSIFGRRAADATVEWWKFTPGGKATGRQAARAVNATPAVDDAVYWSVGLMKAGTGRANANVEAVHALVADDVGTKVDRDLVDLFMPAPTAVVETSTGNFQYVWAVPAGMAVIQHRRLWAGMEALLGVRMDGSDQSHLFRLPEGVNGKPGKTLSRVQMVISGTNNPPYYLYAELDAALPAGAPAGLRQGTGTKAAKKDICAALTALPNDGVSAWCSDRKSWIDMGMAIKGALGDAEGLDVWLDWCGQQPQGEDPIDVWEGLAPHSIGWGYIEILAKQHAAGRLASAVFDDGDPGLAEALKERKRTYDDFWAYMPDGSFIDTVTRKPWTNTAALNNTLPGRKVTDARGKEKTIPAADILQRTKPVHQRSWLPGKGMIVDDTIVREGGVTSCPGNRIYNLYEPPEVKGDATRAGRWIDHVKWMYPAEWEGILLWMAHRVQRPWEKINHALVLGGDQGVGKSMLLDALHAGVGDHNVASIDPPELLGRFNKYRQSVVLEINEIHNLGDSLNPYRFYEQTKTLIAAPPNTLRVDEKYVGVYAIPNVVGVVMTTNHKLDGLYIEENDRRHFIAWSPLKQKDLRSDYFDILGQWLEDGGRDHAAAYLRAFDLSGFNPKAPPEKTATWQEIVGSTLTDGQDETIADVLDLMKRPAAFTRQDFMAKSPDRLQDWIERASKPFANKLDNAGYRRAVNRASKDGRFYIAGRSVTIYVSKSLTSDGQDAAVAAIMKAKT
jgi:Family of unknown function (DUF5906)/Primase C terminal 2 (PriCT-2)